MSLNDDIRDAELRHHVGIQRLATEVVRRIIRLLDISDAQIVAKLQGRRATLASRIGTERLRNLLRAIRDINHDAHVRVNQSLRDELSGVARYESEYQTALIRNAVGFDIVTPSVSLLDAVVTSQPFEGVLLRDYVKGMRDRKFQRLQQAIQLGMVQGETSDDIVRRVRGTKARGYRDGVLNISRVSAERMVRTAVNHVSNAAREVLFEQNRDVVKRVQWVATLDTRTCPSCGALDGKTFRIGEGPRPPRHLNCRCTVAPVTRSWRDLGIPVDDLPPVERASMNGQVSGTETFETWLRRQSAAVQDEALGATRGALFRRGGLRVQRFTDTRGNQLTLDDLREREKGAFRRAGVA